MPLSKPKRLAGDGLKAYALRQLAGRALSSGELREKLRRKAENPADVDAVMKELEELRLTDDGRFAGHFASSRASSGTFGRQRVLTDLMRKRVPRKVAEHAVTEAYSETDEPAQVRAWLERKYRGKNLAELLKDPAQLAGAFRRLRTAGFSSAASIRVLKTWDQRAEDLEDNSPDSEDGSQ
jgi:regulatory protein